jgi:hypothetical protein
MVNSSLLHTIILYIKTSYDESKCVIYKIKRIQMKHMDYNSNQNYLISYEL